MAKMTFRASDHKPEKGVWLSFKEWKKKGYVVLKGEKARRYVHGVAVFHESQVDNVDRAFEAFIRDEISGIGCGWDWWKY